MDFAVGIRLGDRLVVVLRGKLLCMRRHELFGGPIDRGIRPGSEPCDGCGQFGAQIGGCRIWLAKHDLCDGIVQADAARRAFRQTLLDRGIGRVGTFRKQSEVPSRHLVGGVVLGAGGVQGQELG